MTLGIITPIQQQIGLISITRKTIWRSMPKPEKRWKKFNFTAGLRFEDYHVERITNTLTEPIKFKNTNLFPNASAIYEVNDNVNISASYSEKNQSAELQ